MNDIEPNYRRAAGAYQAQEPGYLRAGAGVSGRSATAIT